MDTLLTDSILNIAKGVLVRQPDEAEGGSAEGGINFDFFKQGKEGMVEATMAASTPLIKQVSSNIGQKVSSSFPAAVAGAIQQLIDEKEGANGALGLAAGLISKFVGDQSPGDQPVNGGGYAKDVESTGGSTDAIQQLLQNLLAPKVLLLIQPYLQKFEAQMVKTLKAVFFSRFALTQKNEWVVVLVGYRLKRWKANSATRSSLSITSSSL
jgi:hypothetical protein